MSTLVTPTPTTSFVPAEQRVILNNISWETYKRLLSDLGDKRATRLAYNQGRLQIMSLSRPHERISYLLEHITVFLAEEFHLAFEGCKSTTLSRDDLERGIEPDASFYIRNEPSVRNKSTLDLSVDPPPDLVIEVDVTSGSLDKFPIYEKLGVPEIWHYDESGFSIHHLGPNGYVKQETSLSFPPITSTSIRQAIEVCRQNGQEAARQFFKTSFLSARP